MGSAETATDLESPQCCCCHCICYFYVADCLTDADCFDFVEFAYVPRGFDYEKMHEQQHRGKTHGSPIVSAVVKRAPGKSAWSC